MKYRILFVLLMLCKLADASYTPMTAINNTRAVNKSTTMSTSGVIMIDTFTISSANPTLQLGSYIRNHGYTRCATYSAIGFRSGAVASNSPQVAITGFSDTTVTLLFTQNNTATVTILGINVLSGLPMVLVPDPTNVKVVLSAYLY